MRNGTRNAIMAYFRENSGGPITPAEIGQKVGGVEREKASSWGGWRLRQLAQEGKLVQRYKYGPYYLNRDCLTQEYQEARNG